MNSPVRAFGSVGGVPRFIKKAQGAYVWDENDQQYIDYVGSWGPAIVGHAHPEVIEAVREVAEESGVDAVAERLALVHALPEMTYPNGDRSQYLDHVFACRWIGGEPWPADGENTDARFFDLDALPELSATMRLRLDAALGGDERAAFLP